MRPSDLSHPTRRARADPDSHARPQNKPEWYASKVNPASKVPVIAVGKEGDENRVNIPESGVLLELVADLFPEAGLNPADPVQRAEARYFAQRCVPISLARSYRPSLSTFELLADLVHASPRSFTDVVTSAWYQVTMQGKPEAGAALLEGVTEIQSLLNRHKGTFLLGDKLSIGDLAVAPFIGRIYTLGKAGASLLPSERLVLDETPSLIPFRSRSPRSRAGLIPDETFSKLASDSKYERFRKYHEALTSRPSWKVRSPLLLSFVLSLSLSSRPS